MEFPISKNRINCLIFKYDVNHLKTSIYVHYVVLGEYKQEDINIKHKTKLELK